MFLEEIEKNQTEYIEKAKKTVIKYFIDFFGENYRDKITNKIANLPMFFIDKSETMLKYFNFLLEQERNSVYIDIFESLNLKFKNKIDNKKFLLPVMIEDLLNASQLSLPKRNIKFVLDLIGKNKIEVDDELVKKIKICYDEAREKNEVINKYIEKNNLESKNLTLMHYNFDNMILDKNAKKMVENIGILNEAKILNSIDKFCDDEETDASYNILFSRVVKDGIPQIKHYKYCLFPNLHQFSTFVFVHELLHAVSNNIKDGVSKTGFQTIKNNAINCEYLNEVITEYFAENITNKMRKDKECPFFRCDIPSRYTISFNLIEPFIKKYEKEVRKIYVDEDVKKLENYFGSQNLIELTDLLIEYSCLYEMVGKDFRSLSYIDGLKIAKNINFVPETLAVEKYMNCYRKMEKLLKNINTKQKSNNCEKI